MDSFTIRMKPYRWKSHREVANSLAAKALHYSAQRRYNDEQGQLKTELDASWNCVSDLIRTVDVMAKVIRSREKLFAMKKNRLSKHQYIEATSLGRDLQTLFATDFQGIKQAFPYHQAHPLVMLAEKHLTPLALIGVNPGHPDDVVLLNQCVTAMRAESKTPAFRRQQDIHVKATRHAAASMWTYLRAQFREHSRLLVIRLDVGYKSSYCAPQDKEGMTFEDAQKHRRLFLRYLTEKCPVTVHGFIWRLGYGLFKGWHFHWLLLVDASESQNDVTIARILGEVWRDKITEGKGTYYNCNANKMEYQYSGIGMVHCEDGIKFSALKEYVLPYLIKQDFYLRMAISSREGRSFGHGKSPKPKAKKRGRPRIKTPH